MGIIEFVIAGMIILGTWIVILSVSGLIITLFAGFKFKKMLQESRKHLSFPRAIVYVLCNSKISDDLSKINSMTFIEWAIFSRMYDCRNLEFFRKYSRLDAIRSVLEFTLLSSFFIGSMFGYLILCMIPTDLCSKNMNVSIHEESSNLKDIY